MIWETVIGTTRLVAIEDGWYFNAPERMFPNSDPAVWSAHPELCNADGNLRSSMGCFLVETPTHLLMVDVGMGPTRLSPEPIVTGQMPAALDKLDIPADEVGTVIHTHLHVDHVGGHINADGGDGLFPGAQVFIHADDLSSRHWDDSPFRDLVEAALAPLHANDQIDALDGPMEVHPGVRVVETPGHTPGHLSVEVASDGRKALLVGDALHHPFQVPHPDWIGGADEDPPLAVATRRRVIEELVDSGTLMAAGHFEKPGFGHVVTEEGAAVFRPL